MSDILKEIIVREPDLEVVAEIRDHSDLSQAVDRTKPDVVVLGISNSDLPPECDELVRRHRTLRVLAVDEAGRSGFIYELRPQRVELGELSPELVVAVLRGGE